MKKWEYLKVAVTYTNNGNIDLVLDRNRPKPSQARSNKIDAYFNMDLGSLDIQLNELKQNGWELYDVIMQNNVEDKTYYFKRCRT